MRKTEQRLAQLEKEVASIQERIRESGKVPTNYKYAVLQEQLQLLIEKAKDATPADIPAIAHAVLAICTSLAH